MAQLLLNPSKKKFRVFEWGLRDIDGATHFSRYCNAIVKSLFLYIFCQNMLKNEISINSIHKILSTMSFQTFSGSFTRYCNEFVRRFDCDLRDIDGATPFEPIEKEISGVWMGFKGHRWRNSFSRYCNAIVKVFFNIFLSKYVERWDFYHFYP